VNAELIALGRQVESALGDSVTALFKRDLGLADRTVRGDMEINRVRYQLEDEATAQLSATSEPGRIRLLVATLYVLSDLERIGDHAEGIAKVALMIGSTPRLPIPTVISDMAELVKSVVNRTLLALEQQDAPTARLICTEDDEVDALYDRAYGELLSLMGSERGFVTEATYLLWVTHNLERIADRATNICERIVYLVTGRVEELNVSKY
jgi:phosphate transport system protein